MATEYNYDFILLNLLNKTVRTLLNNKTVHLQPVAIFSNRQHLNLACTHKKNPVQHLYLLHDI